jgi:hypothetical protein
MLCTKYIIVTTYSILREIYLEKKIYKNYAGKSMPQVYSPWEII